MTMQESSGEVDALFRRYVDICNQALSAHREAFPYKQIWGAVQGAARDKAVRVAIYDDQPKTYELHLEEDHIEAAPDGLYAESPVCRINLSYLRQVVEHPEEYIHNPARLDWDWLRNRLRRG